VSLEHCLNYKSNDYTIYYQGLLKNIKEPTKKKNCLPNKLKLRSIIKSNQELVVYQTFVIKEKESINITCK